MRRFVGLLAVLLVIVLFEAPAAPAATGSTDATGQAAADAAKPVPAMAAADAAEGADPDATAEPPEPELPPLIVEARAIRAELTVLREKFEARTAELEQAIGEDREVLERQIAAHKLEYLKVLSKLVDNMAEQARAGIEGAEVRAWVMEELPAISNAIVVHIDASEKHLRELRRKRVTAEGAELDAVEDRISAEIGWLESLLSGYLENLDELETLGLDHAAAEADLRERLATRADRLAGRIQLMVDKQRNLEARIAEAPEDAGLANELRMTERRKKIAADAMSSTVDMMDRIQLDSTAYRQLLIRSTGEVTVDVFRGRVAIGLLQEWIEGARVWLREAGPTFVVKALFFLLTLAAFRVLAWIARRIVQRTIANATVGSSQLVNNMVLGLATRGIMLLGLLVALSGLGVELGPLLAGLGIAGFIVGFALQDSLSNFAAGIMILGYRPYDIGDVIEAGNVFGSVSTMSLVSTTILTFDNQTLIVPNAKIWGDVIKNVTNQQQRRVDLEVHVAKDEDVARVREVLLDVVKSHAKVLEEPEPNVRLHALQKSSLQFIVRPWVATTDYWEVYWDLTESIKHRFDEEGIEIPDPKRDVHIVRDDAADQEPA